MRKYDNKNNKNYSNCRKSSQYLQKWENDLKKGQILSVLFTGVGGQGIILATTVLAKAAIESGFDVKVSEVHGMAQRGGSVEGSVRIGKEVFSPIINRADFIIALEKLEALRYIGKLQSGGFLLVNDYEIYPSTVFSKDMEYPKNIEQRINHLTKNYMILDAAQIALQLHEIRAANMVLLGAFSNFLPLKSDCWASAIKENVPPKALNTNIEAFYLGKNL
ncbi:MAG: indolepyruvate oxidoreductase subunit beta [Actinobacteria bacterium]|nr:indolepyruvate oxidoreductase subunit beta [Actinomycetota bacterium]